MRNESYSIDDIRNIIHVSMYEVSTPHSKPILDENELIKDFYTALEEESTHFFEWYMDLPMEQKWFYRTNKISVKAMYSIFKRETTI